jgi:hypothetical protein
MFAHAVAGDSDLLAAYNNSIAASSLFSVTGPESDTITSYTTQRRTRRAGTGSWAV